MERKQTVFVVLAALCTPTFADETSSKKPKRLAFLIARADKIIETYVGSFADEEGNVQDWPRGDTAPLVDQVRESRVFDRDTRVMLKFGPPIDPNDGTIRINGTVVGRNLKFPPMLASEKEILSRLAGSVEKAKQKYLEWKLHHPHSTRGLSKGEKLHHLRHHKIEARRFSTDDIATDMGSILQAVANREADYEKVVLQLTIPATVVEFVGHDKLMAKRSLTLILRAKDVLVKDGPEGVDLPPVVERIVADVVSVVGAKKATQNRR